MASCMGCSRESRLARTIASLDAAKVTAGFHGSFPSHRPELPVEGNDAIGRARGATVLHHITAASASPELYGDEQLLAFAQCQDRHALAGLGHLLAQLVHGLHRRAIERDHEVA